MAVDHVISQEINMSQETSPVIQATPPNATATIPVDASNTNVSTEVPAGNDNTQPEAATDIEAKQGRKKSDAWNHFAKLKVKGEDKAQCNYCKKLLGGKSSNGTTHLLNHYKICTQRKIQQGSQKALAPIFNIRKGTQEMTVMSFDPETSKKELAAAIIMHEYPLSIVDHVGFRRYSASLQPLFTVPSRNTIKKEVLHVYEAERDKVLKEIDNSGSRVAVTTDLWTAGNQKKGFMAVTAHYIDSSWTLKSQILRFIYVPAPHTSERLSVVLVNCLMDWGIDMKVSSITVDNCTTNDAMISKVKDKLGMSCMLRDGSLFHMRCCAHILNLIVKDGLDVVREGIERIRDSVAYWSATPKRLETFEEAARQLKLSVDKRLCLDCPTRWNSTYKMLTVAILYKNVFARLKQREAQYTSLPTSSQWEFATAICEKLRLFNNITELFSGTRYPTANTLFSRICDVRLAITQWLNSPTDIIRKMAEKMWSKFQSYWDRVHVIMGVAAVLDPRYKLDLVECYFEKIYGNDSDDQVERIKQLCYDMVTEYQEKVSSCESFDSSSMVDGTQSDVGGSFDMPDFDLFVSRKKRVKTYSSKAELDDYLKDGVLPRKADFDILMWWKLNGAKYPTLQSIAKDVLAIPATTVASESAFSASGRVIGPHRSRLHWTTVEALMCARSWLWSENGDEGVSEAARICSNVLGEVEIEDDDGIVGMLEKCKILD